MKAEVPKKRIRYIDIEDPLDEIIGKYLGAEMRQPTEDDLIRAIDEKYRKIHWCILFLKRQGFQAKEIMKTLNIGEVSYGKAVEALKEIGHWKEYQRRK